MRRGSWLVQFLVPVILGLCCVAPVAWTIWQVAITPQSIVALWPDRFRGALLGRTLLYNGLAALMATILALPAGYVLGRGRGILARTLWLVLPLGLLLPSLVYAYGWKQIVRLLDVEPMPAGFADVSRCVWTLACWLWPIPAGAIGLALRRADTQVQQQALLDGALGRITLRLILPAAVAGGAVAFILASQEFGVFEPTGISVIATEVRMVFETGAFSSLDNPITAAMTGNTAGDYASPDQRGRAAAALVTALPTVIVTLIVAVVAILLGKHYAASEPVDVGDWPATLDAPGWAVALSWVTVFVTLVLPVAALFGSLKRPFAPSRIFDQFSPQVIGSLLLAASTGVVVLVCALASAAVRSRWALPVAAVSFLIGGQMLAVSLIRIYNRREAAWVYDGPLIAVMAYVGRFAWIALAAGAMVWTRNWRPLRQQAGVDGASAMQTAWHVIFPLAFPVLFGGAMLVAVLSMTEVPATVLLAPQRPQPLIPMLMTWLHMQRSDDMIEACLVMLGIVVVFGSWALALVGFGLHARRHWRTVAPLLLIAMLLTGCGRGKEPEEMWSETGRGPGQVVYPRAIVYNRADDSFYIVDRAAHVQHWDGSGKFIAGWQMPEFVSGKPVGISVGPDGNVYLADTHYHRIMVYDPRGNLLKQWGERGNGPGQFTYPTDIAFDDKGNIFVSEYGDNDRIQVFDTSGKFLRQFGKFGEAPGEFIRPQSMLIVGDTIYLTDSCNHRIGVWKTDGTFVRNMGSVGAGPGQFRYPYGLDMDKSGMLIVCEYGNNRVQRIDPQTGEGKGTWGMAGREPGELAYPWAVAVDKKGRIVTVDSGNNRIQIFRF